MFAKVRQAAARRIQARFARQPRARLAHPLGRSDLFDDAALRIILRHLVAVAVAPRARPMWSIRAGILEDARCHSSAQRWAVGYDGLRLDLPAGAGDFIQSKMSLRPGR